MSGMPDERKPDLREWTLNPPMPMEGGRPAANGPHYVTIAPAPPQSGTVVVPKSTREAAEAERDALRATVQAAVNEYRMAASNDEWREHAAVGTILRLSDALSALSPRADSER